MATEHENEINIARLETRIGGVERWLAKLSQIVEKLSDNQERLVALEENIKHILKTTDHHSKDIQVLRTRMVRIATILSTGGFVLGLVGPSLVKMVLQ